jgi:hypothetical protein
VEVERGGGKIGKSRFGCRRLRIEADKRRNSKPGLETLAETEEAKAALQL